MSAPESTLLLPVARFGQPSPRRSEIVLVHGVGLGPWIFACTARLLAASFAVAVVDRPGYGSLVTELPAPLDVQVERLAATLRSSANRSGALPVLVGVSGGATLALAALLRYPHLSEVAVVHEPLLGPLAPDLHAAILERVERLRSTPGPEAVGAFMAGLVGSNTWAALDEAEREAVLDRDELVRCEVEAFTGFAVDPCALERLATSQANVVTTVGSLSAPARHLAATILADALDTRPQVLDRCGHLAPVDAPERFVDVVTAEVNRS